MTPELKARFQRLYAYAKEQLTETSTLRGLLVLATLGGGWLSKLPIDATLAIAIVAGSVLKIMLPDKLP